jgi:hypothetical protein
MTELPIRNCPDCPLLKQGKGVHYFLTPVCDVIHGICPKTEDGKCEGCETKQNYLNRMKNG